jgi:predicted ester cyclase
MRHLSLLDSIIGKDFLDPASTSGKKGPEDLREVISGYLSVYPDLTIKLEDLVADHHKVAWKYSATGTNKNTGEKVTFSGIIIDDIEQGKIVNWVGVWMRSISDLTSSSPHSVSR